MLESITRQASRLSPHIDLRVVAAGSEKTRSRYLAECYGAGYVECMNKPLGKKWTRAMAAARAHNPDAVVLLGSDNIVNDAFWRVWASELAKGYEYVGAHDAYQWSPSHARLIHWAGYVGKREGEPIGSSRCFSKALLDKLRWHPWREDYNRGLDWSTTQKLKNIEHSSKFLMMNQTDARHLGTKLLGEGGAMSGFLGGHADEEHDPLELLDWFGDDLGSRLLALADLETESS